MKDNNSKTLVKIRPLTQNDSELFTEGVQLLNRTQGEDLFAPDYLDVRTKDSNSHTIGAFLEDRLVGVGIAQIINSFEFYLPFDANIAENLKEEKVGSFSTLAVMETFQGKGIGQKISQERLKWLKEKGCTVILGVSWVSGLEHTSDRVFERMGFKAIKKVDHLFKEMSLKNPFYCPGCKLAPCNCAGILYRWP